MSGPSPAPAGGRRPPAPGLGILLVAPPGAGKGTQGERIAAHYRLARLSTGELLRAEVAAGTELGRSVVHHLARGDLAPTELVLAVLQPLWAEASRRGGYVLDGFPRSVAQAQLAERLIEEEHLVPILAAVHLVVSEPELRRRLEHRAAIEGRADDLARASSHRLEVYEAETRPLLAYYADRGLEVEIDGERPADTVTAEIIAAVDERVAAAARPR